VAIISALAVAAVMPVAHNFPAIVHAFNATSALHIVADRHSALGVDGADLAIFAEGGVAAAL
jgi:hypothetical protein